MAACVLVIDDEPDIRELVSLTISRMGLDCHTAANLAEAGNLLANYSFDACLTDMRLPDGNGVEFIQQIKHQCPDLPVAVVTAHGDMDAAVVAMKNGAYDFVSKPVDITQLRTLITTAVAQSTQTKAANDERIPLNGENSVKTKPAIDNHAPQTSETRLIGEDRMIGNSDAIQALKQMILKLARTNAPVWISGESGTGKELTARLIHENSARHEAPFIAINCGAIPAELMESEFFGHKKGSFTGAVSDHEGLFSTARGGTLFLDEIAELPLSMQVKLLRAIQEKSIRPVGTATEIPIDVRILSASHKDLAKEVADGQFRHDLYYRLNVIGLIVPSLRERRSDVQILAKHLLTALTTNTGSEYNLSDAALEKLSDYDFPGNVRELENIIERTVAIADSPLLDYKDLQFDNTTSIQIEQTNTDPPETIDSRSTTAQSMSSRRIAEQTAEKEKIISALNNNRWNRKAAAEELGLTYRQLRYRIEQLGLDTDQKK